MEISTDLMYNIICDMKKKEMSDVEKGEIVRKYMNLKNLSLRTASTELGIPKTTIQNWLCFTKLSEHEYQQMQANGYTKTQIRNGVYKNKIQHMLNKPMIESGIDNLIRKMIHDLNVYRRDKFAHSSETAILLYELKECVRKLEEALINK